MEWVKLYATPPFYLDGALLRAGEAAEVLFCRALAHCGNSETRGRVDKTVLPLICSKGPQARANALVREGLWSDEGDHYRIRSWDRLQDEHDAAAVKRAQDRDRQREKRRRERDLSRSPSRDESQSERDESRDSHADAAVTSGDSHAVDVERDVEEKKTPSVSSPRKRATPPPDLMPITEQMAKWGREHAPLITDPTRETRKFLDHARANGKSFKDWSAAWRTWMANAQDYASRDGRRAGTPVRGLHPSLDQSSPSYDPHLEHLANW